MRYSIPVSSTLGLLVLTAVVDSAEQFPLRTLAPPPASTQTRLVDIDRDGTLDLVGRSGAGITIQRGDGLGAFLAATTVDFGPISPLSRGLVIDIDADSDLDLVGSGSGTSLFVRRNDGHGAFAPQQSSAAGVPNAVLAAGDFDGDGNLDVVAGEYGGGNAIALARGDGAGGFANTYSTTIASTPIQEVMVFDFDVDGRLDVGVSGSGAALWLKGDGLGGLAAPIALTSPGSKLRYLAAADGDSDGDVDLALADLANHSVLAWRNDGGGSLTPIKSIPMDVWVLATFADLDADGRQDLVTYSMSNELVVLRDFFAPTPSSEVRRPGSTVFSPPEIGHVDGDAYLDVVQINMSGNSHVCVIRGDAEQVLEGAPGVELAGPWQGIASADADSDGDADLYVQEQGTSKIHLLKNDGTAHFALASTLTLPGVFTVARMTDLDADGALDLVAITRPDPPGTGSIITLARGTFGGALVTSATFPLTLSYVFVDIGDFDGDGKQDYALSRLVQSVAMVGYSSAGYVPVPIALPVGGSARRTEVDFDRDGLDDLIAADHGTVTLMRSQGVAGFLAVTSIDLGPSLLDVPIHGDLNGDTFEDLVISTGLGYEFRVLLGTASGSFTPSSSLFGAEYHTTTGIFENPYALVDVDEDGHLDLLGTNQNSGPGCFVEWFRGRGDGTFEPSEMFSVAGVGTFRAFCDDFDADGDRDVLTTAGSIANALNPNTVTYLATSACRPQSGRVGIPCALPNGRPIELSLSGCTSVGEAVELRVGGAFGASFAALIAGTGVGSTPISGNCSVAIAQVLPFALPLPIGTAGDVFATVQIAPSLLGMDLVTQAVAVAPSGALGTSNGVRLRIDG